MNLEGVSRMMDVDVDKRGTGSGLWVESVGIRLLESRSADQVRLVRPGMSQQAQASHGWNGFKRVNSNGRTSDGEDRRVRRLGESGMDLKEESHARGDSE